MTPEQSERCKAAIMPLAERLTGEQGEAECTMLALLPGQEKTLRFLSILGDKPFEGWQVPLWARKLWISLLAWRSDHVLEPWVAPFALRTKAALISIQLTTPGEDAQAAVHQRVFIRFVCEALRPFAEWAAQREPGDPRSNAYLPLRVLWLTCKEFTQPVDPYPWRLLYQRQTTMPRAEGFEAFKAWQLAEYLLGVIIAQLNLRETISNLPYEFSGVQVAHLLNRQHQFRLDGQEGKTPSDGTNYTELTAQAFLTALEAECPPPDWLP